MNDHSTVIVVGGESASRQVRDALARHNIAILGAGMAVGMSVEQASALCTPLDRPKPRARVLTDEDRRRIAAAEEKRNRRAGKRATKEA